MMNRLIDAGAPRCLALVTTLRPSIWKRPRGSEQWLRRVQPGWRVRRSLPRRRPVLRNVGPAIVVDVEEVTAPVGEGWIHDFERPLLSLSTQKRSTSSLRAARVHSIC